MPINVNASQPSSIISAPSTEAPSAPSRTDAEVSRLAVAAHQVQKEETKILMTADELAEWSNSLTREQIRLLKEGPRMSSAELRRIETNIFSIQATIARAVVI